MNCPDIERLIDFGLGESEDQELAAHVRDCEACQVDLQTIRLLAGVEEEEWELSEDMIAEIISSLPDPSPPKMNRGTLGLHLCLTAGLGFLTALFSSVATGTITMVKPQQALLFAVAFGALCMLVSARQNRNSTSRNPSFSRPEPA